MSPWLSCSFGSFLSGLLGVLSLAATGCQIRSAQSIDAQASEQLADVHRDVRLAVIWSRCPDPTRALGPDCGLLAEGLRSDEFLRKFTAAYCVELDADACQARHERFYTARLGDRYFAADLESVDHQCDLTPGACDDPIGYEKLLLRSHNDHVHARGAERARGIERERIAAHRLRNAQIRSVVFGGTRCRSRPAGEGESLITCNR